MFQGAECSKEAKYAEKESVLGRSKCSKDQTELRGKVFQGATSVKDHYEKKFTKLMSFGIN